MTSRDSTGQPGSGEHDLARVERTDPDRFTRELAAMPLRDQVLTVLALPPERRAHALLHGPRPMRLVRSLPAPDFFLTIREIGPVDALPLLGLASAPQLQHILDLESWRADRYDGLRAGAWVALLAEAGEPTVRRVIRAAEDSELTLLFQTWARTEQIEIDDQEPVHGHGLTDAGDERGLLAPDGAHRFRPAIPEHGPAMQRVATVLFLDDPGRYQRVIWGCLSETPSQNEDEALRWRNSRLEEHGYPPWDEAITIYAAPSKVPSPPPAPIEVRPEDAPTVARFPLAALEQGGGLATALAQASETEIETALAQLLSIAARVVVADGHDTGDPLSQVRAIRKAAGTVDIGLASAFAATAERPSDLVRRVALVEIFRAGHARVAELQRRANALVRDGWAAVHPDALQFLDAPIRPRIEGLLGNRPLHHVVGAKNPAESYRDFERPEDVEETRGALEIAEVLGEVFVGRLGVDLERLLADALARSRDVPRFSTLFTTLLAWNAVRGELRLEPLGEDDAADFLRTVASRRTAPPDAPERALAGVIDRITERTATGPRERGVLAGFGRACLERLASECGGLEPGIPIDDRHVSCLWLAADGADKDPR